MLNAIEIENFKAFGKRTRLELAPITLIFGENSVGKSSALKALSLIQDCMKYGTNEDPLPVTILNGSFAEFVHDPHKSVCFRLEMEGLDALEYKLDAHTEDHSACIREVSVLRGDQTIFSSSHPSSGEEIEINVDPAFFLESLFSTSSVKRFEREGRSVSEFFREKLRDPVILDSAFERLRDDARAFLEELREQRVIAAKFSMQPSKKNAGGASEEFNERALSLLEGWGKTIEEWIEEIGRVLDEVRKQGAIENWLRSLLPRYVDLQWSGWRIDRVRVCREWGLIEDFFERDFGSPRFTPKGSDRAGDLVFKGGGPSWMKTRELLPAGVSLGAYIFMVLREDLSEVMGVKKQRNTDTKTQSKRPPLHSLRWLWGKGANKNFRYLETLRQIPAVRLLPQRMYQVDQAFSDRNLDQLQSAAKLCDPKILTIVNQWMERLGMPELRIDAMAVRGVPDNVGSSSYFQISCKTKGKNTRDHVSIVDVGFGISQVIPLVIECFTNENSLITIEQPESQIHPTLQTELADMLLESWKELGNRFVVETHSEFMFHRFSRRIRESGELKNPGPLYGLAAKYLPTDIGIYFFSPGDWGPDVKPICFNKKGGLSQAWPSGFFHIAGLERFANMGIEE